MHIAHPPALEPDGVLRNTLRSVYLDSLTFPFWLVARTFSGYLRPVRRRSSVNGQESVEVTRRALRRLRPGDPLERVLAALQNIAPVAAGFLERFRAGEETDGHVTPILLPEDYLAVMMRSRPHDRSVLSVVSAASTGAVLLDRAALAAEAWRNIEAYVALQQFGMFHPLALKLGSPGDRRIVEPAWHTYLALFADDPRYPLTPEECNRLGPLHPDLQRALARIRLPLAMEEPLLLQIVREQRLGMVLLARDGRVLGTNGRAWVLAERFARGSQRPKRGAVRDLTDACLRGGESGEWVRAFHESSGSSGTIVVSRHEILGPPREDVILLLFREIAVPASPEGAPQGPWSALSGRARQIAELLVSSGKPYKQLADDVGIAVGTFRKHVQLLYRTLGVSSRAELTALPRRGRLDPGTHG